MQNILIVFLYCSYNTFGNIIIICLYTLCIVFFIIFLYYFYNILTLEGRRKHAFCSQCQVCVVCIRINIQNKQEFCFWSQGLICMLLRASCVGKHDWFLGAKARSVSREPSADPPPRYNNKQEQNLGKRTPGSSKSSFSDLGHKIVENGPPEVQNRHFRA